MTDPWSATIGRDLTTAFDHQSVPCFCPESSILTTSRYTYAVNVHSASLLLDMPSLSSHAGSCRITAFRRRATRLRLYSYAVKNLIYNYSWNVTVTDITGYSYVFNSSQPARGRDSSVMKLLDVMLLPVTVCVHFKLNNYPDLLWIGFQGELGHHPVYFRSGFKVSWAS